MIDETNIIDCYKLIKIVLFYLGMIFLFAFLLPLENNYHLALHIYLVLFFGYCAIRDIRRQVQKKLCTNCREDILPFLFDGKNKGLTVNNCPFCGIRLNET